MTFLVNGAAVRGVEKLPGTGALDRFRNDRAMDLFLEGIAWERKRPSRWRPGCPCARR